MNGLYRFDLEGIRVVHVGLHAEWLDYVFAVITYTGLSEIQIAGVLILLIWKSTREYVLPLLLVIALSGIVGSQLTKHLIERERPSNLVFAHPQEPIYYNSFPSGHTTTAFACAFMLLFMTLGTSRAKWGWLALVWAAFVGMSRVYRGVHWPTDTIAGMCFGLLAACIVRLVQQRIKSGKAVR